MTHRNSVSPLLSCTVAVRCWRIVEFYPILVRPMRWTRSRSISYYSLDRPSAGLQYESTSWRIVGHSSLKYVHDFRPVFIATLLAARRFLTHSTGAVSSLGIVDETGVRWNPAEMFPLVAGRVQRLQSGHEQVRRPASAVRNVGKTHQNRRRQVRTVWNILPTAFYIIHC